MAVEFTAARQTVLPGEDIIFTAASVVGNNAIVHRDDSGIISLPNPGCGCNRNRRISGYEVLFTGNIAFPTTPPAGETAAAAPLTLAFAIGGEVDSTTRMYASPAAADTFVNVSKGKLVLVPGACCTNFTVRNTSGGTVTVEGTLEVKGVA